MSHTRERVERELARGSGLSIIALVDALVGHAHALRASDIHLDPTADALRARFRVDGALEEAFVLPKHVHAEIVSRIKVLASLRTDEHQVAQDGRFRNALASGEAIDIRVSIAPTYHGENAVLRLLSDRAEDLSLAALGFGKDELAKIKSALKHSYGMVLATGPTGSGKTTTLYTLLKELNKPELSIITIEDPIEYAIDGIRQIQVNARTGLSFANGLRSILRQDPNIIMVGEIRDTETAGIAVNTALTGHLVLSTLHTNDAATTLPRLLDMKIDPYLVASTVSVAIGQRLVRRICAKCRENVPIARSQETGLGLEKDIALKGFFRGKGCGECNGSGYRGRVSVNEVLVVDEDMRRAIVNRASASDIRDLAHARGMRTMLEDGIDKASRGVTTLEEVMKAIHE